MKAIIKTPRLVRQYNEACKRRSTNGDVANTTPSPEQRNRVNSTRKKLIAV